MMVWSLLRRRPDTEGHTRTECAWTFDNTAYSAVALMIDKSDGNRDRLRAGAVRVAGFGSSALFRGAVFNSHSPLHCLRFVRSASTSEIAIVRQQALDNVGGGNFRTDKIVDFGIMGKSGPGRFTAESPPIPAAR
jgi:hypothetical protein